MSSVFRRSVTRRKADRADDQGRERFERLKPWLARLVIGGVALASVAFVCEVYRSLDESRFDLGNGLSALGAALRSLGPTH